MTQRPRYPRVNCCVPFCRRGSTKWPVPYELICGEHYRMADKALRMKRARVRRKLVKLGELDAVNCRSLTERACRIDNLFWARIKRQATERALGISA